MPAKKGASTNFIVVDGIKFYKTAQGYYSIARAKRLHVYVWEKHNGPVPKGHDVHHIDGNKDNNDISNLECVLRKTHHEKHMRERGPEELRRIMDEYVRPLAIDWHKSEEGRAWHREQYNASLAGKWADTVTKVCEYCGKEYSVPALVAYRSHFCSNNCKSQHRRVSRVDDEQRVCIICGATFFANKYSKIKTCSPECSVESAKRTKAAKRRRQE